MMFLFIDESGDPGFIGSSTKYFILSAVIFHNMVDLQETQDKVKEFIKIENLRSELHFVRTHKNIRNKFFDFIKDAKFQVKAICVNKEEMYKENKNRTDNLHDFILKMLLDSLKIDEEMIIVLDGKGNKILQSKLRNYLKLNTRLKIKKLKIADSKKDILLQLADMVASAIGHSYNRKDRENSDTWKKAIAHKTSIWEYKI
jgi:hypothetical protein